MKEFLPIREHRLFWATLQLKLDERPDQKKVSMRIRYTVRDRVPIARQILREMPIAGDLLIEPIRQKRIERRYLALRNEGIERKARDLESPLRLTTFCLTELFRKPMGGSGYHMNIALCDNCDKVLEWGEKCTRCEKRGRKIELQRYKSPICRCPWSKTELGCCDESIKAGYGYLLYLEVLTRDVFIDHIDIFDLYCYEPVSECARYVQYPNNEVSCEECYLKNDRKDLGTETVHLGGWHVTSLNLIEENCMYCKTKILKEGHADECIRCSVNAHKFWEPLRQDHEIRTRFIPRPCKIEQDQ